MAATEQLARELVGSVSTSVPHPVFDGSNPDRLKIAIPDSLHDYADVQVEMIDATHPKFLEYAHTYIANILHRDNIMDTAFVWPPFKLAELTDIPDDQLFGPSGEANPSVVEAVVNKYVQPTIADKGNHLLIMHGKVGENGEDSFIGGGLSFDGVVSENEGWISKGIIAKQTNGVENRRNGLGRALQEARIMHWMLSHPDKSNLHTGVNVFDADRPISPEYHLVSSDILNQMDVFHQLRDGRRVTSTSVQQQLHTIVELLNQQARASDLHLDAEALSQYYAKLEDITGNDGFQGFTPESMVRRKDIIAATAQLLGVPLTATEHTYLRAGGQYVNAIDDSAAVKPQSDWVHTRRLVIRRKYWEKLIGHDQPAVIEYLDERRAA